MLQHLAGVPVEMRGGNIFQGVVLKGWWGGVELPAGVHQGDGEGRAVPGRRADGANSLGRRLCRQRLSLKAAVFPPAITPAETGVPYHPINVLRKMQIWHLQGLGSNDFTTG